MPTPRCLTHPEGQVLSVAFSPDGGTLLAGTAHDDGTGIVQFWDPASGKERELLRNAVEHGGLEHVQEILKLVKKSGALDYTRERALAESMKAREALKALPASPYRDALSDLAEFSVARRA